MKINKIIMILVALSFGLLISINGQAFNSMSDCLVTNDIGTYTFMAQSAHTGEGSGIIGATGHFKDHVDMVCEGIYSNINEVRGLPIEEARQKILSVEVQVTEHAGADSDRWLLHEVEDSYRSGQYETLGLFTEGVVMRKIDSNRVYWIGLGGGDFMWLSDNKVIKVSYVDLQGTKPEPLEVVKAYLQKHPSTITMTDAEAKGRAHNEAWIKDEMERRLWLGDKWFTALQLEKAELGDVLREAVGHMGVFLDYREKYYGISGDEEKARLSEFLRDQNGTEIKNRLEALKSWWADNKDDEINL